jgi:hypothetical protein
MESLFFDIILPFCHTDKNRLGITYHFIMTEFHYRAFIKTVA